MANLKFLLLVLFKTTLAITLVYYCRRPRAFEAYNTEREVLRQDMAKREHLMREFCKNHKTSSWSNRSQLLKNVKFYVDDKHKFIYCHMPKIATTTWLKVLLPLVNYTKPDVHRQCHFRTLANYSTAEALYRMRNYYKFVFVRDPFERLVSTYKDKIANKHHAEKYIRRRPSLLQDIFHRQKPRNYTGVPFISFPKFIAFLTSTKMTQSDDHADTWSSVFHVCHPCFMNYSFIGHYETLKRDAEFVLEKLGLDKMTSFPSWRQSKTTSEAYLYFRQLSKEQRKEVYEILKKDYEMTGYTSISQWLEMP